MSTHTLYRNRVKIANLKESWGWARTACRAIPPRHECRGFLRNLMNTTEYRQPTHREELERELVHGAASQIAHAPENAAAIAKGIKTVLDELAPVAPHPVAIAPLPAIDPGPNSHAAAVLYPAIERAMGELSKLHEGFNMEVNRAFNILRDAFWSECPAPASAVPKRRETADAEHRPKPTPWSARSKPRPTKARA